MGEEGKYSTIFPQWESDLVKAEISKPEVFIFSLLQTSLSKSPRPLCLVEGFKDCQAVKQYRVVSLSVLRRIPVLDKLDKDLSNLF